MKMKDKRLLSDMHVHSIFSKYAYSTITENINYANSIGLKYLAITDHIFQDGSESEIKNEAIRFQYLEKEINYGIPIYVIGGAEFNLFQKLQFKDKFKNLSWRIVGLHKFPGGVNPAFVSLQNIYQEFVKQSKYVNGFAHIERELHEVDFGNYRNESLAEPIKSFLGSVVELAKSTDIYLELNESSLRSYENLYYDKIVFWLTRARELNCKIYLGSDSRFHSRIGNFEKSLELLKKLDYPESLVLNFNENRIKKLINK